MSFFLGLVGAGIAVLLFLAGCWCGRTFRRAVKEEPTAKPKASGRGELPAADPVRWQEWINFLSYDGGERPEIHR